MPNLSKLDILSHKTHSCTKVPWLGMCRSITSLNKIPHQLWHDNPLSQRNKATKRAVGLEVGSEGRNKI